MIDVAARVRRIESIFNDKSELKDKVFAGAVFASDRHAKDPKTEFAIWNIVGWDTEDAFRGQNSVPIVEIVGCAPKMPAAAKIAQMAAMALLEKSRFFRVLNPGVSGVDADLLNRYTWTMTVRVDRR